VALTTEVYRLHDILAPNAPPADVAVLARAITRAVAPSEWQVNGGKATLAAAVSTHDKFWRFVIHGESSVQAEVKKAFDRMREIR